jgi:hypothetical protein
MPHWTEPTCALQIFRSARDLPIRMLWVQCTSITITGRSRSSRVAMPRDPPRLSTAGISDSWAGASSRGAASCRGAWAKCSRSRRRRSPFFADSECTREGQARHQEFELRAVGQPYIYGMDQSSDLGWETVQRFSQTLVHHGCTRASRCARSNRRAAPWARDACQPGPAVSSGSIALARRPRLSTIRRA